MRITDEDDKGNKKMWVYEAKIGVKETCLLIFDESKDTYVLEKFGTHYDCNLVASPDETDPATLRGRYPQIDQSRSLQVQPLEVLSGKRDELKDKGDEDEENPIDENNSYDIRRWMRGDFHWFFEGHPHYRKPPPIPRPEHQPSFGISPTAAVSASPRPSPDHRVKGSDREDIHEETSPNGRAPVRNDGPHSQKRKRNPPTQTTLKQKPRVRREPHRSPPPESPSPSSASPSSGGEVMIVLAPDTTQNNNSGIPQRTGAADGSKADFTGLDGGEQESSSSSDDGLIIEMEENTKQKRTLGARLDRPVSGGPISLRSAANSLSPHSSPERLTEAADPGRVSSPGEEDEEDEDDGGEEEDEDEDEEKEDNGDQREADSDVDADLELPPPVLQRDDEGELEAELAQALESEDFPPPQVQGESESEEE